MASEATKSMAIGSGYVLAVTVDPAVPATRPDKSSLLTRPQADALLWACDPLLAFLAGTLRLRRGYIAAFFGALYLGIVYSSGAIDAAFRGLKPLLDGYGTLLLYPLFIFNAVMALTYYRRAPIALGRLFGSPFLDRQTKRHALAATKQWIRLNRSRARTKNWVITLGSILLVGAFHAAFVTASSDWMTSGRSLSLAGWLHFAYITAMVMMALQFICAVYSFSRILFAVQSLVERGVVQVAPLRLAYDPAVRPIVGLFWISASTLAPLFCMSVLQVLIVTHFRHDLWFNAEVAIFFPVVYFIAAPLMILGHLYPVHRIISHEKERMLVHFAAIDASLVPTNLAQLTSPSAQGNIEAALRRAKTNEKLWRRAQDIRTLPADPVQLALLVAPFVIDLLIKHLAAG